MTQNHDDHAGNSIVALRDWWERQRGVHTMPRRKELDPGALVQALPDLIIVDVTAGEAPGSHAFTYRLSGTRVDACLGLNLRGRTAESSPLDDAMATVRHQFESVVEKRRPLLCHHLSELDGTRHLEYELLVMPLSGPDGGEIVALVGAVDFTCAYLIAAGRPALCHGPNQCSRKNWCLPPDFVGSA